MAWSKAKTSIMVAIAGAVALLLVIGGVNFFKWFRDPDRIAAAKEERANAKGEKAITKHLAEPLNLTGYYQGPAPDYMPNGFQTFNNVPLQIDGLIYLWGAGSTNRGNHYPEEVTGIPVARRFETLYVYHCAHFSSPVSTSVYEIVFRYVDGTSATNKILYGKDILDWFASGGNKTVPTAPRSKLAWSGFADLGYTKQTLRFCLTAVENPQPTALVESIDLYSCKHRTAGCILAITPGKAGLMK